MSQWEIHPFQGLGSLHFGTPRSIIRSSLNSNYRSFRKGPFAANETDAYDTLGFHLYYDDNDNLEFIETFSPCDPVFSDIHLLNNTLESTLTQFTTMGYDSENQDAEYNFTQLGFVLYVPDSTIESVAIYRKGYYDE